MSTAPVSTRVHFADSGGQEQEVRARVQGERGWGLRPADGESRGSSFCLLVRTLMELLGLGFCFLTQVKKLDFLPARPIRDGFPRLLGWKGFSEVCMILGSINSATARTEIHIRRKM